MPSLALAFLPLLAAAWAAPSPRATAIDTSSHCGQWDTVTASPYILNLDQWGISGATGSDCANLVSLSGTTIAWQSTWSWSGGSGVKTFTNIELTEGINVQLSDISAIEVRALSHHVWMHLLTPRSRLGTGAKPLVAPSSRTSRTISSLRALTLRPVSLSSCSHQRRATSGGSSQNYWEIMIWLANYNSGPISYNYDSSGNAVPIETGLSLAGHTWYALSFCALTFALTLRAQGPVLWLERVQLRLLLPPVEHHHELLRRREHVPQVPHQRAEPSQQPVPHHVRGRL